MDSGDIFRHDRFYADSVTGELLAKYLLIMAPLPGGDWVARLLTSRENARPRVPPCFHGMPYPGYYVGVLGLPLDRETWIDLRAFPEIDADEARVLIAKGILQRTGRVANPKLRSALECTAGAADTTRQQEQAIRDQLARLP